MITARRTGVLRACRNLWVWTGFGFALFVSVPDAQAQYSVDERIRHRTFDLTQGLPQSSPSALTLDRDGFVWGATFGGMFRFDGREITPYGPMQVPFLLPSPSSAIASSHDGSLWVGRTRGGIARFRDAQLLDTLPTHPLPESPVTALFETEDRVLWGIANFSPIAYAQGRWWTTVDEISVRRRTRVIPDSAGAVLMASNQGVWRLWIDEAVGRIEARRITETQTSDVARDRAGRLWVAGDRGIRMVPSEGEPEQIVVPDIDFRNIIEDQHGNIWGFGEIGVVITEVDGQWQVAQLPADHADQYRGTTSSLLTPDGVVLIGILGEGLRALEFTPVEVWKRSEDRPFREASSMASDGVGGLWVGAQCDGVYRLDSEGRVIARILPSAACALSLARDATGRLWIGDTDRLQRYSPDGTVSEWPTAVPGRRAPVDVRPLVALEGDAMLAGMSDGRIGLVDAQDNMSFPDDWQIEGADNVFSIERDHAEEFWFGLEGAVVHRRIDGTFERFDTLNGVPSGELRVVKPRVDGSVWLGSYGGGLALMRPDRSVIRVPLDDPTVVALLEDGVSGVWIQQNSGLTWFSPETLAAIEAGSVMALRPQKFGLEMGIPEGNSGRPPLTWIDENRVAFGSVDGIVVLDRRVQPEPAARARPEVDRVLGLIDDLEVAGPITLGARERYLRAHVTMPDFRSSGVTSFRYRLEGRDPEWITVSRDRWIELAGLMPGRYRLLVEAGVRTGEWVPAAPLEIQVPPTWSEWLWLRVAILGLLATALLNWLRLRLRVAQQREAVARAEAQLVQQVSEQREQHQRDLARVGRLAVAGELSAALVHELGQPLGSMVNDAAAARIALQHVEPAEIERRLAPILDDLVAGGRRVRRILNGLRGFFSEGLRDTESVDVEALVREAVNLLESAAQQARVTISVDVQGRLPTVPGDRGLLLQVLVVLLTNAIEAVEGCEERQVLVRLRHRAGGVSLVVLDSGAGIPDEVRGGLYDAFVTDKPQGMGMGLPIAHRIIQAHGGWIRARNTTFAGAAFRVTLRLGTMTVPSPVDLETGTNR